MICRLTEKTGNKDRRYRKRETLRAALAGASALLVLGVFLAETQVFTMKAAAAEVSADTEEESPQEDAEQGADKTKDENAPASPGETAGDETGEETGKETGEGTGEETGEAAGESLNKEPAAQYVEIAPGSTVIGSEYAVLMSGDDGTLVAGRNAFEPMYPASMTKIMTVLVAAENIRSLSETAVITQKNIDYAIAHDCTTVGFKAAEQPTMADLLYGTILISGADAALTLAEHIAGSSDAFVELMNEKAASLGLKATHFTNPIGLFAEDNVSTAQEVAVILAAAVRNPLVHKILSTQQYTTSSTKQHPDGITITNMFLLRSGRLADEPVFVTADEAAAGIGAAQGNSAEAADAAAGGASEGAAGGAPAGESDSQAAGDSEENREAAAGDNNDTQELQVLEAVPGLVLSAKTGYVNQSRYCAASLFITEDGRKYICVTGKTDTAMHCVEDHRAMYSRFIPRP